MKQVKLYDIENDEFLGGIELDDGSILCGCCGGVIEPDDEQFEVVKTNPSWNWWSISDTILKHFEEEKQNG